MELSAPDELLDKVFRKIVKIRIPRATKFLTAKYTAIARINKFASLITLTLNSSKALDFSKNKISRFYYELADLLIGVEKLNAAQHAIASAMKIIENLRAKYIADIKLAKGLKEIAVLRKEAYGRICSAVKNLKPTLEFIKDADSTLKNIPVLQNLPTVVVAGYPNVGKSSVVKKLSSAKPEVAQYPFTTKALSVGYFEVKRRKYQIIDSPGLLDRELSKRNKMELQAILALKHLAHCIVFLIDPTFHCGYALEPQLRLLEEVNSNFNVPVIEVETKRDILKADSNRLKISTETGEGMEELKELILRCLSC
ncbi:MAG: 50S ribosome-binding GTPase [Candidatus Thermoplasmatota archaeon]|nr:50S ribosome-binding GTPase [Candidatus Thermoplasmatota archaeon]